MTHGTLNCDNKETSDNFLANVLGLSIIGGGRMSTYITVPSGPWYVVVLPTPHRIISGSEPVYPSRLPLPRKFKTRTKSSRERQRARDYRFERAPDQQSRAFSGERCQQKLVGNYVLILFRTSSWRRKSH
jgi:hypothetical protein